MVELTSQLNNNYFRNKNESNSINLSFNHLKDIEVNVLNPRNNFEQLIVDLYQKIQNIQKYNKEIEEIFNNIMDLIRSNNNIILTKNILDKLNRISNYKDKNIITLIAKIYINLLKKNNLFVMENDNVILINFINNIINLNNILEETTLKIRMESAKISYLQKVSKNYILEQEQKKIIDKILDDYYKKFRNIKFDSFSLMINSIIENINSLSNLFEQYNLIIENISNIHELIEKIDLKKESLEDKINFIKIFCYLLFNKKYIFNSKIFYGNDIQTSKAFYNGEKTEEVFNILNNEKYLIYYDEELENYKEHLIAFSIRYAEKMKNIDEFELLFVLAVLFQRIYFSYYDDYLLIPYKQKFNEILSYLLISICQYQRESNDVELMKYFLKYILNNKNSSNKELQELLKKKMKEKETDQTYDFETYYEDNFLPEYEGLNLFNNDDTIGFFNEMIIPASTIESFFIEVNKKYAVIDFSWSIDDYDITCKITNENEDKVIYEGYKKSGFDTPIKLIFFESEPVKYKIIFDNYYSWFTSKTVKYKINIFYPECPFNILKKISYVQLRQHIINIGNTDDFYDHLEKICKINFLNQKSFNAGYIYNNIAKLQQMLNEGILTINNIYIDITLNKFYNEKFECFDLNNETFEKYIKENIYNENIFNICNIYNISKEQIKGNNIEDFLGFIPEFKSLKFSELEFVVFFCSNLSDIVLLTNIFKKTFDKEPIADIFIQVLYVKNISYQISVFRDSNLLINNEFFKDVNSNESLEKNAQIFKQFIEENNNIRIEINIVSNDEIITSEKIGNSINEILEEEQKKKIIISCEDSVLFYEASNTGEVFQLR